jgi:hypothetical protein
MDVEATLDMDRMAGNRDASSVRGSELEEGDDRSVRSTVPLLPLTKRVAIMVVVGEKKEVGQVVD